MTTNQDRSASSDVDDVNAEVGRDETSPNVNDSSNSETAQAAEHPTGESQAAENIENEPAG